MNQTRNPNKKPSQLNPCHPAAQVARPRPSNHRATNRVTTPPSTRHHVMTKHNPAFRPSRKHKRPPLSWNPFRTKTLLPKGPISLRKQPRRSSAPPRQLHPEYGLGRRGSPNILYKDHSLRTPHVYQLQTSPPYAETGKRPLPHSQTPAPRRRIPS